MRSGGGNVRSERDYGYSSREWSGRTFEEILRNLYDGTTLDVEWVPRWYNGFRQVRVFDRGAYFLPKVDRGCV